MVLRRLFVEKLNADEISLQEGGVANVNESPFARHQDWGKRHAMTVYHMQQV